MVLIAIPTENRKGRHSLIAETLSRARMITLIRIDRKPVIEEIQDNPFFQRKQGVGALFADYLNNLGVKQVITKQIGPGSRSQLESLGIMVKILPDLVRVEQAVTFLG